MLAHFLQVMLQQIKLGTGSCCCLLDVSAEFSDKLNQPVLKEANGSLASGLAAGTLKWGNGHQVTCQAVQIILQR